MAAVTIHSDFRAQEEEICQYFRLSPSICYEIMGPVAMILVFFFVLFCFLIFSFSQLFHTPPSHSSRDSLVSLCFVPLEKDMYHLHI